jgi:hypothetical protein
MSSDAPSARQGRGIRHRAPRRLRPDTGAIFFTRNRDSVLDSYPRTRLSFGETPFPFPLWGPAMGVRILSVLILASSVLQAAPPEGKKPAAPSRGAARTDRLADPLPPDTVAHLGTATEKVLCRMEWPANRWACRLPSPPMAGCSRRGTAPAPSVCSMPPRGWSGSASAARSRGARAACSTRACFFRRTSGKHAEAVEVLLCGHVHPALGDGRRAHDLALQPVMP